MASEFQYLFDTAKRVDSYLDSTIEAIQTFRIDWIDMAPECASKVASIVNDTQQELIRKQNSIKDSFATSQVATTSPPIMAMAQAAQYANDIKSASDLLKFLAKLPAKLAIILMAVINKITEISQQAVKFSVSKLSSLITQLEVTIRSLITKAVSDMKASAIRYYCTSVINRKTLQIQSLASSLNNTSLSDLEKEEIRLEIKRISFEIESYVELANV